MKNYFHDQLVGIESFHMLGKKVAMDTKLAIERPNYLSETKILFEGFENERESNCE